MARIALTFDDGPGPATPTLLDLLLAHGVRATFFLLGQNLLALRATAVRMAREGHVLGNHTFTHGRPGSQDARAFVDEIRRTDDVLAEIQREAQVAPGLPPVRLPYGPAPGDPRLPALASLGRAHVHWTADFQDWTTPPPAPEELAQRMLAHARAQAEAGLDTVIDLHDSSRALADRSATVEAVRLVLDTPGLSFFSVPV
jgi:chitin deacetylase